MPVSIRDVVSIAAGAVVENVINSNTGAQRYIRPPFNAIGRMLANQRAAGLLIELIVNGRTVVDLSSILVKTATTLDPLIDLLAPKFFVGEGQQLVLRASNPTGGAIVLRYQIELEETDQMDTNLLITQRGAISIAAGAKVQLLSGLKFERPRVAALLQRAEPPDVQLEGSFFARKFNADFSRTAH